MAATSVLEGQFTPSPSLPSIASINEQSESVDGGGQDTTPPRLGGLPTRTREEIAEDQIKHQEHQRVLGIFPTFNVTTIPNAEPLSPKQKFQLALKSATDPVTFGVAAFDAGLAQWQNSYKGYGQGTQGYFKRWGASYADAFDGALLGNALFPTLLHQDPRYFRKGIGTKKSRFMYAIESTVRAKSDIGNWQPNFSNILGNVAAGGIANLYYPSTDRGVELTFERAFTVTAEGAFGAIFVEFWPDVARKLKKKK